MFVAIRLVAQTGALVAGAVLPAFQIAPSVVRWGGRIFLRDTCQLEDLDNGDTYREVLCIDVIPAAELGRADLAHWVEPTLPLAGPENRDLPAAMAFPPRS